MELINKKTGEKARLEGGYLVFDGKLMSLMQYNSLAELTDEWEDAGQDGGYWYYDTTANHVDYIDKQNVTKDDKKKDQEIGNCFETKEEAEKAVEKLKALKILKDHGLLFGDWELDNATVADGKIWFDLGGTDQSATEALQDKEVESAMNILFK